MEMPFGIWTRVGPGSMIGVQNSRFRGVKGELLGGAGKDMPVLL